MDKKIPDMFKNPNHPEMKPFIERMIAHWNKEKKEGHNIEWHNKEQDFVSEAKEKDREITEREKTP